MQADDADRAAVSAAAAMGTALTANVDVNDAEGLAAKESIASFAASLATLDALMNDSSDDELIVPGLAELRRGGPELLSRNQTVSEDDIDWKLLDVGLEVQKPWSQMLLSGVKKVETRSYKLPAALVMRQIAVLETEESTAGISALPDQVLAGDSSVRVAGTVIFGSCIEYLSHAEWLADAARHCVSANSAYAWSNDRAVFGWVVEAATECEWLQASPALRRCMRSLFEVSAANAMALDADA